MLGLPQRQSREKQTVDLLRERIARGQWREWLPAERTLCELLQVCRSTLRCARDVSPRETWVVTSELPAKGSRDYARV